MALAQFRVHECDWMSPELGLIEVVGVEKVLSYGIRGQI
jgi:hypothetical protein